MNLYLFFKIPSAWGTPGIAVSIVADPVLYNPAKNWATVDLSLAYYMISKIMSSHEINWTAGSIKPLFRDLSQELTKNLTTSTKISRSIVDQIGFSGHATKSGISLCPERSFIKISFPWLSFFFTGLKEDSCVFHLLSIGVDKQSLGSWSISNRKRCSFLWVWNQTRAYDSNSSPLLRKRNELIWLPWKNFR